MKLSEKVKVSSRFQRSIKIDSDIGNQEIVDSYVCPQSSVEVLLNMANGYDNVGEASFTWTGPYGSGKSSLVVALNALIGKNRSLKKIAVRNISGTDAEIIGRKFGVTAEIGWDFLPVVGFKGDFEESLRGLISVNYDLTEKQKQLDTIDLIEEIAKKNECGLFIVVDEMGKFLEEAAEGGGDVYFFQQIAESAARSNGKIVFLGILHQAFAEYGRRLTRDIRDEWLKIQGRFVDLPLNVAGEEIIEIIGRAIQSPLKPKKMMPICQSVAQHIANWRPVSKDVLADSFTQCWPLHPVTAALLGPISRRRFGQNQRSVFGFLNSAEPFGFQYFLKNTEISGGGLFTPDILWDYLQCNLEPSIMASPDGHRWSIAVDALTRAESYSDDETMIAVVKSIALMNMFHERSGLMPGIDLISTCFPEINKTCLKDILRKLEKWSILLFKKHKKSYSLYEGSDFDIEAAIKEGCDQVSQLNFEHIRKAASFQPVVAKKHYHSSGALRWMDVDLVPSEHAVQRVKEYAPSHGAIGLFMVVLAAEDEQISDLEEVCKKISKAPLQWPVVTSIAKKSHLIRGHARELQVLEWIKSNNPSLGGDTVARREVESRLADMKYRLAEYLQQTLSGAEWYSGKSSSETLSFKELHQLASKNADKIYKYSPRVNSELANRIKPSSNSNAALKIILKAMVENVGQKRLGIKGYPAEGGLYEILLGNTRLYDGNSFVVPNAENDHCNIIPVWQATDKYFKDNGNKAVSLVELYNLWLAPPYGIKNGMLPFFAVAYIMTRINNYAAYLEGIYRPSIDDLFIDVLMKSPSDIALRPMNFSDVGQRILAGVCDTLNKVGGYKTLLTETSKPLEIARRLVALIVNLPPWVLRTRQLSKNTIRIRELIKNASDPNKVLFDDLPYLFKEYEENLRKGDIQPIIEEIETSLQEMVSAYPNLLENLRKELLDELEIDSEKFLGYGEINIRAENILHVSGDFNLDAFAARLVGLAGSDEDIEGIASLAAGKPTKDWIDLDVSRAKLRIAEFAQQFNHNEAYGRVHNREDYRQAVAFMVGVEGKPKTYVREFTIRKNQHGEVNEIEALIKNVLNGHMKENPEILLAALANIGAEVLNANTEQAEKKEMQKVTTT